MGVFKNEYTLQSCKSKQTLYEHNIIRFKDENFKGKITEDGFKVFKRLNRHYIYRTSPYQGVFIGEITENENGCEIKLTSRISYFFLVTLIVFLNTHVIFPMLLCLAFYIFGNPINELLHLPLLSIFLICVFFIVLYVVPRKGEEELVKNILIL